MYTILYSKWITNKDLLYSTWNSTQSFCASLDGRGLWGRMDTCICTAESLHGSPESTATLFIGFTHIQNKKFKVRKKITNIFLKKDHTASQYITGNF